MPLAKALVDWRRKTPQPGPAFQLGQLVTLPYLPCDSILDSQRLQIGPGACGHPLVIIGVRHDCVATRSTLLQITSFHGQLRQDKFHDMSNASVSRMEAYLAISHKATIQHGKYRPLTLLKNRTMRRQSYINLDQFFTIEAMHLRPWYNGQYQLDQESITTLEQAFFNFLNGFAQRPERTEDSETSPFDYWSPNCLTASYLGVNEDHYVKPSRAGHAVDIVAPLSRSPSPVKRYSSTYPVYTSTNWRNPAQSHQG